MKNHRFLGVLPARGGSKGIPGKNLRPLAGKPLLHWAARALVESEHVSRAICSTDASDIAEAAASSGLEIPFLRPPALASDTANIVDVLKHAVEETEDLDQPFSHIVLVQATSPTVTSQDINRAVSLLNSSTADTIISGFRADTHHPAIMYSADDAGSISWLFKNGNHAVRRQDFPTVFIRTGLVYVVSIDVLKKTHSIYGSDIRAIEIESARAITIDEELDFILAKQFMEGETHD